MVRFFACLQVVRLSPLITTVIPKSGGSVSRLAVSPLRTTIE